VSTLLIVEPVDLYHRHMVGVLENDDVESMWKKAAVSWSAVLSGWELYDVSQNCRCATDI